MFRAERAPKNWIFPSKSPISAKTDIDFVFCKTSDFCKKLDFVFPENKNKSNLTVHYDDEETIL